MHFFVLRIDIIRLFMVEGVVGLYSWHSEGGALLHSHAVSFTMRGCLVCEGVAPHSEGLRQLDPATWGVGGGEAPLF